MYCIKCGAKLSDGQAVCPICNTRVYHPDFPVDGNAATYPRGEFASEEFNRKGILFVITVLFALAAGLPLLFEWRLTDTMLWSDYVALGMVLFYLVIILPFWFRNPNPVIFVPCDFAAAAGLLLYICLKTGGSWFLSFAFPVTFVFGGIVTAVVALCRYLRRGKLYIFGGGLIGLGFLSLLIEFFLELTFGGVPLFWSIYPAITFVVCGISLIVIAIVKPLRESLRRFFYL